MGEPIQDLISERSIMITGAAGFVGSNLAEILSRDSSNTVLAVDDLSAGTLSNLECRRDRDNLDFHRLDIRDSHSMEELAGDVDVVLHQAAMASVPASLQRPLESNSRNVGGTIACLEACRKAGIETMVYASSCAVYGDDSEPPLREADPAKPISPYGASKLAAEQYCEAYHRIYGIRTVSLRYFNVYGPRQDPSSQYTAVIPKFIGLMLDGQRPTVFGDGEQVRDFTYIDDIVRANCIAAEAGVGGVYNVSGGQPVSINVLVEKLNHVIGTDLDPEFDRPRPGDIQRSWADLTLIGSDLGFEPKYSIEAGLERTVSYYGSIMR